MTRPATARCNAMSLSLSPPRRAPGPTQPPPSGWLAPPSPNGRPAGPSATRLTASRHPLSHSGVDTGRPRKGAPAPTDADDRFDDSRHPRRTLASNGKQASVIWAGVGGGPRAWRTCAFCECARQHVGAGWTVAALASAQERAWRVACAIACEERRGGGASAPSRVPFSLFGTIGPRRCRPLAAGVVVAWSTSAARSRGRLFVPRPSLPSC